MITCERLEQLGKFDLFSLDLTLLSSLPSNWIVLAWDVLDVARLKNILIDLQ